MSKFQIKGPTTLLKVAGLAVLAATVAGCEGMNGGVDDVYEPSLHYQRFPIQVSKGKVQMKVPARSARLSAAHEDAVARFAQSANSHQASQVSVARPSGQTSADAVAGRITQVLNAQGVPSANIRHTTYSGHGPVIMSYSRYMAHTAECGDWSEDFGTSTNNGPYSDMGCTTQSNIAAMVANPKDLVQPRTMDAPSATRRAEVLNKYGKGQNTATQVDAQQQISISEAVK